MADSNTLELLVEMVKGLDRRLSDLDGKVDNINSRQVTRHEFEAAIARLDTFIIRGEFEQFKALNEQQRQTAIVAINSRIEALEGFAENRGRLPNLWVSVLSILAVLGTAAQAIAQFLSVHTK